MERIDKNSRLALYYQLVDIIINEIETGKLSEHDKLLSEREYCDRYDISRATVRQAIQELEKKGYVYKEHGKGTFVSPKAFKQDLLKFYSFTDEMEKIGKNPSSNLLKFEINDCSYKVARRLNIEDESKVYKIIRLRLADYEPMMYEVTYLPYERFPNLKKEDLINRSMYDVFRENYKVKFSKAEETLKPVLTGKKEAELLEIEEYIPSMLIERIAYEGNTPIEYTKGIARGDRFVYRVVLD